MWVSMTIRGYRWPSAHIFTRAVKSGESKCSPSSVSRCPLRGFAFRTSAWFWRATAPEQIFTTPPFICIEILSKDDRLSGMQDRIKDYLTFGVPHVWILNPQTRSAWRCTTEGMFETQELRTENPEMVLPLAPLFE